MSKLRSKLESVSLKSILPENRRGLVCNRKPSIMWNSRANKSRLKVGKIEPAKGIVRAICISRRRGVQKTAVPEARLIEQWGIEGDAHAGQWPRQVSLLAVESIEKIRRKGIEVGPGDFAENIVTEGVDLLSVEIGDRIELGQARLEVTQIGKECHSRCAIYEQAGDCVMPREGIFARVLKGGEIKVGDSISVVKAGQEIDNR